MALIIKGEMPKGKCWWHDEQGKEHECQFFPCDAVYCLDPEDKNEQCLIIGEIPDKHGRLIDADALVGSISDTYCEECPKTKPIMCKSCEYEDIMDDIENAPTVLEANND